MFLCLDRRPNQETPWFGVTSDKTGSTYDLPVDKCGAVYMTCGDRLSRCELLAYVDLAMTCRSTSNVELASSTLHTQVDSAARIDCRPIYLIWPLSLLRAYLQPHSVAAGTANRVSNMRGGMLSLCKLYFHIWSFKTVSVSISFCFTGL